MDSMTSKLLVLTTIASIVMFLPEQVMAIEEPEYGGGHSDGPIEVRDYTKTVVAEVKVDGDFENASNKAFRPLFNYISDHDIAMTAPVSQAPAGTGWAVRFIMPAEYSVDELPKADNPNVEIREIPSRRVAAIRYSGGWSAENYNKHLDILEDWLSQAGYDKADDPIWARYNAPYSLWFMRRNEIHIAITTRNPADSP